MSYSTGVAFRQFILLLAVACGITLLCTACKSSNTLVEPGDPPEYTAANGFNGGRLFDKFWAAETGWDQADPNLAIYNANADFFRCKQCHGWDLLGNRGAYISRAPKATRPNVTALNLRAIVAGMTPQELFDSFSEEDRYRAIDADLSTYDPATNPAVGDEMPDFGSVFTDALLWDLVKFLKETALDTSLLYDSATTGVYPTGSIAFSNIGKDGNAANGDAIFAARCATCHGTDGRAFLVDGDEYTIGSFVRSKPNEAQHKIRYGQLGSAMGSLVTTEAEMKDVYKALTDTAKYPDPQ